jgi:predicted Zn-dependent protease
MLEIMTRQMTPGGTDFAKTHPSPQNRISELKNNKVASTAGQTPDVRKKRFTQALGRLL